VRVQLAPHRFIIWHAVGALLLTVGIAWTTPLAFSGFRADQSLSNFWLLLSDSGAKWGVGFVLLLSTALVAARQTGLKARAAKGLVFFTGFCVLIGAMAAINEFGIKRAVEVHRPYIKMLEREGLFSAKNFYALPSGPERRAFLEKALEKFKDHPAVKSLDPNIREHWGAVTGYSFPSGHSVIAFLFATILAFLIENLIPKGRRLVWIPFLWASGVCLSRVAVGAHSPMDITVGALLGGMAGGLILATGWPDRVLPEVLPNAQTSSSGLDKNHAN
jgi:phosphatidylglycerophosphatase B